MKRILVVMLLLIGGCAGSAPGVLQGEPRSLPSVANLSVSDAPPAPVGLLQGAEFDPALSHPGVTLNGDGSVDFDTSGQASSIGTAWAIYRMHPAAGWEDARVWASGEGSYYFGLADFAKGRWEWTPANAGSAVSLEGWEGHCNSAGEVLFVVMSRDTPLHMESMRLSPQDNPPFYLLPDPQDSDWAEVTGSGTKGSPYVMSVYHGFNEDCTTQFSFVLNSEPDGSGEQLDILQFNILANPPFIAHPPGYPENTGPIESEVVVNTFTNGEIYASTPGSLEESSHLFIEADSMPST